MIRLDKDVEAEDDDFDADADYESIEEPVTQRGDIWILETTGSCAEIPQTSATSTL